MTPSGSAAKKDAIKAVATNRKAFHDYFIDDRIEAGIALTGTEVKSLRDGRAQLKDSYVQFRSGEAFLVGAHISPYGAGSWTNHLPERGRRRHARGDLHPAVALLQGLAREGGDRAGQGEEAARQEGRDPLTRIEEGGGQRDAEEKLRIEN
jgi:hypothetical protein